MELTAQPRAERVDRDLRALGAVTQAILDGDDLEQLLGRIAAEARVLADAASGVVVTVAGASGVMTFRAVDGLDSGHLRVGYEMPVRDTMTERAVLEGRSIVAGGPDDIPTGGRAFAAAAGTGPAIAAPLAMVGPAKGAIVVARDAGAAPFSPADVTLVGTFAAQAAAAIELFELRSAETVVAANGERQRIARELHDGIVAGLRELRAGIGGLAEGADERLTQGIRDVLAQLDAAIETIGAYALELQTEAASAERPPPRAAAHPAVVKRSRDVVSGDRPGDPQTIAVIGDLARATATDDATDVVLQTLIGEVVRRSGSDHGLVGTVTEQGDSVVVRSQFGPDLPGRRVGDLLPIAETLVGQAITEGRPVMVSPDVPPPGVPERVAAMVGAIVVVPLAIRGRQFGAMAIARSPGAVAFTPVDVSLIEAYAAQAAIALEFDRVRHELRAGSISQERDRIGRDLHTRVVQLLFGVGFALQSLESTVREPAIRARLQATTDALDRTIRDLRRFVFDLGPDPGSPLATDARLEALAADNARLQGEIDLQLEEVRASRRRIIAAGDAERKRVERDLHDGAQQRLVSLTLALRLARSRLGDDLDPSAVLSLEQASDDAKAALAELRELARGIHPQILTEAGLGPAVDSLAARCPVDVDIEIGADRYPPAVEGAAYFTISEGLANISKYAGASAALVRVVEDGGELLIEIADDGVGGAQPAAGTGLRGLADRLDAINGSLEVDSAPGAGTRLVARIPLVAVPTVS